MSVNDLKSTTCGFQWGPATVERLFSDDTKGWVTVGVQTAKGDIQICVTKTGKIRVHGCGAEWLPQKKTQRKKGA